MFRKYKLKVFKFIYPIRISLVLSLLLFTAFSSDSAGKKEKFEAESAKLIGDISKMADKAASGGYVVSLTKPGDAISFSQLPAAGKLAIRYASLESGIDKCFCQQSTHPKIEYPFFRKSFRLIPVCHN